MFEINALEAFGISIDVDSVWDDTVKCDLRLRIAYDVECDGWEHGWINMPGICLNRRTLLELSKRIAEWKDRQADSQCGFTGTFDLSVIADMKTELSFDSYVDVDEKTKGKLSFQLSNTDGTFYFVVDESALVNLSTQLTRLIQKN